MSMPDNSPQSSDEQRDWNTYFLWDTIRLLRTLDVWNKLSTAQKKRVETYCKLQAATVREDTGRCLTQRELLSRISELKAVLANVPMPTLSYEQIQNRIAQLESQMKDA